MVFGESFIHPIHGPVYAVGKNMYKQMGGKKRTSKKIKLTKGTHPQHGAGLFDSIGNFFKKTVLPAVKESGIISKIAGDAPLIGSVLGPAVKHLTGYGVKRVRVSAGAAPKSRIKLKF